MGDRPSLLGWNRKIVGKSQGCVTPIALSLNPSWLCVKLFVPENGAILGNGLPESCFKVCRLRNMRGMLLDRDPTSCFLRKRSPIFGRQIHANFMRLKQGKASPNLQAFVYTAAGDLPVLFTRHASSFLYLCSSAPFSPANW